MKNALSSLLVPALFIGQAGADLIPGGDFQLYKPGEPTVTATLTAGYVPWNPPNPPTNLAIAGGGSADYSDMTSGTNVDLLGWTKIQGNVDLLNNGVGGSVGCNAFAAWGGDTRIETDPAVGTVEAGKIYTISVMVSGPAGGPIEGPLAFHLLADGVQLIPSSQVDVTLPPSGFQEISRTYDTTSTAGHVGAAMTIVVGVEDANDIPNRVIFDDVSLEVEDAPMFSLRITPTAGSPGNYDFEWDSLDNYRYDLVSNTDLSTAPVTWPVWDGRADIVGAGPSNLLPDIPGGGDPKRFFAVVRRDPPPLLSEDFESDDGGFTFSAGAGTDWAWGTPMSTDNGGTPNPGGSVTTGNNSAKCWGTGIGNPGYYANPTTDSCLRTPDFSLAGVTSAALTFAEALDIESNDLAEVKLINAVGDVPIATVYTATDGDTATADWEAANGGAPIDLSAGIGATVYLQWCLTGTGGGSADYMGWYIDDVVVTAK